MKKIIAFLMAALMLSLCLAGCGAKGKTLAEVQEAGKIVIATSPDFPPFESLEGGQVVGIEIDIMELICKELGVQLEVVQMDFDSVLAGIQSAKYDCGMSGITVNPKREKNMLFTDPYYNAAQVIVVAEGSPITGKADLSGKTVSVQTGTTAESGCQDEGIAIQAFNAKADAKSALTTGKVDAWVIDDLTAAEMVKLYNEENGETLVVLSEAMTTEPYAFAFNMKSGDLVEAINPIIQKLVEDGTVAQIFQKYNAPYTSPSEK